jgi:REP-associated tyrosine transposase
MARTIYSEINLHITWHTKNSAPVITDSIETQLYRWLRGRILQAPGVLLLAIGGTDDHVHLAVTVPPTLLVSEWIGELKGASAHYVNHTLANRKIIEWQSGYGVVSFGTKAMPWWFATSRGSANITLSGQPTSGWSVSRSTRGSPLKRAPWKMSGIVVPPTRADAL